MQSVSRAIAMVIILSFTGLFPGLAYAKHGGLMPKWVNQSTDGQGNGCCGDKDCTPASSVQVLETNVGYADVVVDGMQGTVYDYAVRTVRLNCRQDKSQPYVCVNEQFHDAQYQWKDCVIAGPDGTFQIKITPACVRCILIPECDENYS